MENIIANIRILDVVRLVHGYFIIFVFLIRDRPFNLKGGLWFFVSFKNKFSDNTRVRIFIFYVALSAKFFSRI
jgi:hypothetical protein